MAKQDSNITGWITVKGRRVPIRKGEGSGKGKKPLKLEDPKKFEDLFEVASPEETANAFGRNVKTHTGKIIKPNKKK